MSDIINKKVKSCPDCPFVDVFDDSMELYEEYGCSALVGDGNSTRFFEDEDLETSKFHGWPILPETPPEWCPLRTSEIRVTYDSI